MGFAGSLAGRFVARWRTESHEEIDDAAATIESRVERLERRVTTLEQLPARIDDLTSQISHLRMEMRDEFSAVRGEMADQGATIVSTLRSEIAEQGATIISTLRGEIADRDDARGTQMRVLYEDVTSRLALLQEGLSGRPKRKQRKKP